MEANLNNHFDDIKEELTKLNEKIYNLSIKIEDQEKILKNLSLNSVNNWAKRF